LKLETATRAFRGSFCGIDFLFNLFFELHRNTHSWFVLVFCRLCQIAQFFHLAARFAAAFAAPLAASMMKSATSIVEWKAFACRC
jgi:hypothetical protein